MIDPGAFALYLGAAAAMILSPGPDTVYVLTRSLAGGRRVGLASAAGIGTGVVVHTLAAVLGLAALLRASPLAFSAVTYAGAAYLVFLGLRTLRSDGVAVDASEPESESEPAETALAGDNSSARSERDAPFREAVTVNVLNPQVAIFFLAFLPQFASGNRIAVQLAVLGGTYAVLTVLYLGSVAVAASALRRLLIGRPTVADALRWITGLVLAGLGLRLVLFGP